MGHFIFINFKNILIIEKKYDNMFKAQKYTCFLRLPSCAKFCWRQSLMKAEDKNKNKMEELKKCLNQ